MRAATRSGAVVPLASPSRFRAPALIRPRSQACAGCASLPAMGTFSQPAVGRRGNRARPVPNLAPMGFRRDDGVCEGTELHADGGFSDFTTIVCIHLQDLSFSTTARDQVLILFRRTG